MALYGQTSQGIREDMGLLRERVGKLEGGGTTAGSTSVSVPGKDGIDGQDGADGTILTVATAPTFTGSTAAQIKADLASLVDALTAAGVFK